nr:uncharacterized protein LOC110373656 isoform X1 [Helicoverpa armigera]
MIRQAVCLVLCLFSLSHVDSAKQQVQLSDSYLPVAMQVIAHLTDQMAFEVKDEATPKPTSKPTNRPTTKPTTKPPAWTTKPTSKPTSWTTLKPTSWTTLKPTTWTTSRPSWATKPTTQKPYVTFKPSNSWWTTKRPDMTTAHHKPGLYAPFSPPKPLTRYTWHPQQHRFVLLPVETPAQYTILQPQETRTEEPLLSFHHEQIKPLMEPTPESAPYLPPHYDVKISSRSDGYVIDELSEENLQYLSDDVREMIKMAHDPHDDKLVDVWAEVRQGSQPVKAKLSASNLRLLLLYDLLSRDAKRQRLSDYSGFSPDVMKALVESSSGGARGQLKMALSKMVERHDCGHEYANNRAKEMVEELGKDESGLSAALRYLEPLVYSY